MNKSSHAGAALWVVVAIVSLLCAFGLLYLMLEEKEVRLTTEQRLSETEQIKREIEKELDDTQIKLVRIREQNDLITEQLQEASQASLNALQDLEKTQARLKALADSYAQLKDESQENKERFEAILTELKARNVILEEDYTALKERWQALKPQTAQADSHTDKIDLTEGVDLPKIVVKTKKELQGKVLVVNEEFGFIVIDLGRKNDVDLGDNFKVYRGSQEIATVQIEKVYDTMSTASILSYPSKDKINTDDIVRAF